MTTKNILHIDFRVATRFKTRKQWVLSGQVFKLHSEIYARVWFDSFDGCRIDYLDVFCNGHKKAFEINPLLLGIRFQDPALSIIPVGIRWASGGDEKEVLLQFMTHEQFDAATAKVEVTNASVRG